VILAWRIRALTSWLTDASLPIKLPINYSALPITRRYYLEMIMLLTSTNVTTRHWTNRPKAIPKPCVAGSNPAGGATKCQLEGYEFSPTSLTISLMCQTRARPRGECFIQTLGQRIVQSREQVAVGS